jgi:hypothetical protein
LLIQETHIECLPRVSAAGPRGADSALSLRIAPSKCQAPMCFELFGPYHEPWTMEFYGCPQASEQYSLCNLHLAADCLRDPGRIPSRR